MRQNTHTTSVGLPVSSNSTPAYPVHFPNSGSSSVVNPDLAHRQTEYVGQLFNEMAEEYDHLQDLWYRHTFGEIDKVLLSHFQSAKQLSAKSVALDVGCGTGIQSLRLASMGYKVIGIDIAADLVKIARKKHAEKGFLDAEFLVEDAQSLPFADASMDCINCCGPTLSFVPDWRKALLEMSRCLKPGGKLLLEVEGKWTFDMFWEIISALCFNFFGYDESLRKALGHLLPPWRTGHFLDYSFKLESGQSVTMPLRLFTPSELRRELSQVGLIQQKRWSLHVITNLVPSTILHRANPGKKLEVLFNFLASIERRVNGFWPFNSFGCSLLVISEKQGKTK